jgi:hypothetical protein
MFDIYLTGLAKRFGWQKTPVESTESDLDAQQVSRWFRARYERLDVKQKQVIRNGLSPKGKIKVTRAAQVCKALGMFDSSR